MVLQNNLAVSAGGSTLYDLYELAVTGTPAIALIQADNQKLVAEAMEEKDIINNLGFGNQVQIKEITKHIKKLIENYSLRKNRIHNVRRLLIKKVPINV